MNTFETYLLTCIHTDKHAHIQYIHITSIHTIQVLASDGIWDVMQNEDVAKLVMSSSPFKDFLNIGKKLCTEAIILGSTDNVTALIVDLK